MQGKAEGEDLEGKHEEEDDRERESGEIHREIAYASFATPPPYSPKALTYAPADFVCSGGYI